MNSWNASCEKSLSKRWQITRKKFNAAKTHGEQVKIENDWANRMHRLYMNTNMPESTFRKFDRLADNLFVG